MTLDGLGLTLGFKQLTPRPVEGVVTADTFPKLGVYKELFVHLDEGLSTYENRHRKLPSTLLRAVPVKKDGCNDGRAETFTAPQFKRLANEILSGIIISVRDEHGKPVRLSYLSCVLEVRRIP